MPILYCFLLSTDTLYLVSEGPTTRVPVSSQPGMRDNSSAILDRPQAILIGSLCEGRQFYSE